MIGNVKNQKCENLMCITMREPWSLINIKSITHLEVLAGNEKILNDRNRNDDIIQGLTAEKGY